VESKTVRDGLDFLVSNSRKILASIYHDAGRCWVLIDAAVKEIRKVRRRLVSGSKKPWSRKK
jgi:hypothetical protein